MAKTGVSHPSSNCRSSPKQKGRPSSARSTPSSRRAALSQPLAKTVEKRFVKRPIPTQYEHAEAREFGHGRHADRLVAYSHVIEGFEVGRRVRILARQMYANPRPSQILHRPCNQP